MRIGGIDKTNFTGAFAIIDERLKPENRVKNAEMAKLNSDVIDILKPRLSWIDAVKNTLHITLPAGDAEKKLKLEGLGVKFLYDSNDYHAELMKKNSNEVCNMVENVLIRLAKK